MEIDSNENTSSERKYTDEYRHFDALIWQTPAWCTAIFLVTLIGLNSISSSNIIITATDLTQKELAISFITIMFLFVFSLTHTLYRFRVHQSSFKKHTTPFWASASTYLQVLVTAQAMSLFVILLMLFSVPKWCSILIGLMSLFVVSAYREYFVRIRQPNWKKTSNKAN